MEKRKKKILKKSRLCRGSNPGPLDYKSGVIATTPQGPRRLRLNSTIYKVQGSRKFGDCASSIIPDGVASRPQIILRVTMT